jgi:K+-transporting ATPase ATPase C chain
MKTFLANLKTSALLTLVFAGLLGGAYPLVVWAGGQLLFADQANGSLVTDRAGTVRGSRLLAQSFTSDRYFHPRPSAAGTGYDAAGSSGSNLGPTSRKLADSIAAKVAAYRSTNGLAPEAPVPADAVTSSASGLDPHISPANARLQAVRVARLRGLPPERVLALVEAHTAYRDGNILGEPGVNVLMLNRALETEAERAAP